MTRKSLAVIISWLIVLAQVGFYVSSPSVFIIMMGAVSLLCACIVTATL